MSEHDTQAAFFEWAELAANSFPELRNLFAIPNGGAREARVGKKLKAEGVKAGVWDVFLAVAKNGYHGLFIEFKHGKNRLTKEQALWKLRLEGAGYRCVKCYDWEAAQFAVLQYLRYGSAVAQTARLSSSHGPVKAVERSR